MKNLVVLLLVSLMATSALATANPDADEIGIYFDGATADVNCVVYEGTPVMASVVITRASAATIDGVEYGFVHDTGGNDFYVVVQTFPPAGVDVGGVNPDVTAGDVILGFSAPMPTEADGNLVVYQYRLRLFGDFAVNHFLSFTSVSGAAGPRYVTGGDTFVNLNLSTGGLDIPVASINGDCPVALEASSFGSVKSLFR